MVMALGFTGPEAVLTLMLTIQVTLGSAPMLSLGFYICEMALWIPAYSTELLLKVMQIHACCK